MRTVAFTSYKGGVGRTQCVANVGASLVRRGARVGVVDLDFEAPGLHEVFEIAPTERPSMVQLVTLQQPQLVRQIEIDISRETGRMPRHRQRTGFWLLPAFSHSAVPIDDVRWDSEQTEALRDALLLWQKAHALDTILLDCRAGISGSYAAALGLCDSVVIVFRPNRQDEFGVQWMLEHAREAGRDIHVATAPLPFDVPSVADVIERRLRKMARVWRLKRDTPFYRIPYVPELALEERVLYATRGPSAVVTRVYELMASELFSEVESNAL
jgi:MinD-like ATPase involved in chromosome partitioning or flagellar assembly